MQVLVHTDHHIQGRENLVRRLEEQTAGALARFADRLTRVELHVADENARKAGADDIRCTVEARIAGRAPLVVNEKTDSLDASVTGALARLELSLESLFGKMQSRRVRVPGAQGNVPDVFSAPEESAQAGF